MEGGQSSKPQTSDFINTLTDLGSYFIWCSLAFYNFLKYEFQLADLSSCSEIVATMALQLLKIVTPSSGRSFSSTAMKMTIKNVTVIGGGTMGAGIAQVKINE